MFVAVFPEANLHGRPGKRGYPKGGKASTRKNTPSPRTITISANDQSTGRKTQAKLRIHWTNFTAIKSFQRASGTSAASSSR